MKYKNSPLVLLLFLFIFSGMNAQMEEDFGFTSVNCGPFPFYYNTCFPDWINTHGSTERIASDSLCPDGHSHFAKLEVTVTDYCSPQHPLLKKGDGIALNYDFIIGNTYTVTYIEWNRPTYDYHVNFDLILTNGLVNQNGDENFNDCSTNVAWIPNVPQNHQTISSTQFSILYSEPWTTHSVTFTVEPGQDYSYLWFRAYPLTDDTGEISIMDSYILIDNVKITEDCSNSDLGIDFEFTDANGNPKAEFCYGEDVYINIPEVTYDYPNIYITATNLDLNECLKAGGTTGWIPALNPGVHNLSQLFRDSNQGPINPSEAWTVKVAVDHPDCDWVEEVRPFSYICCDIDASFQLSASGGQGGLLAFTASANKDYTPYGGSHKFCLYVEYNGELTQANCSSGPNFSFSLPQNIGINFHLVHTLETQCGDFCESTLICTGGCPTPLISDACELFACKLEPVTGLTCPEQIALNLFYVSWDEVPEAVEYEVSVWTGCPSGPGAHQTYSGIPSTHFFINDSPPCMGYRVRAKCSDGTYGPWSDYLHYSECKDKSTDGKENKLNFRSENNISSEILAFPNPFNNEISISLDIIAEGTAQVEIFNHVGKVIERRSIEVINNEISMTWRPTNNITSGMYFIRISNGTETYSKKLVYQK